MKCQIIADNEWYCDLYPVFVPSNRYLRCSCFISNAGTVSRTINSITEHSPEGTDSDRQFLISPGLRPHPALQVETCPVLCISPHRLPRTESTWNTTWAILHQLLNTLGGPNWILGIAQISPVPEYVHSPAVQSRDKPKQRDCSRWCCSSARKEDDSKQHLLPSFSRLSVYRV